MKNNLLRIGSRGSELALWQAQWVQRKLSEQNAGLEITIQIIKTKGDKILDSPLSTIGDKGLFTKEIEQALLKNEIDLAVHSLKDLPTELPDGLRIGAVCEREDVRDVFIPHPTNPVRKLLQQRRGAKIATGSLRRKCQLLNMRRDFEIIDIRGNLNTRLKKLEESDWDGMILAHAGVARLGWEKRIGETLDALVMLPAVGQGALAIEVRNDNDKTIEFLQPLHHQQTAQATSAERALLGRLEGGCQVPIGIYARVEMNANDENELRLDAFAGSLDGTTMVRGRIHGNPDESAVLGKQLAETLLAMGADRVLHQIRQKTSGLAAIQVGV